MSTTSLERNLFIIFGATGDLTRRKLLPALYNIFSTGIEKDKVIILGVARRILSNDEFRNQARNSLEEAGVSDDFHSLWCDRRLYYQSIGTGSSHDYGELTRRIKELEEENDLSGNRIFNLALPISALQKTLINLGEQDLNKSHGWTRIILEKPFGRDLKSAKELNHIVHQLFEESQIYRIDHYLGKETVQIIMVLRFANSIFEHVWSHDYVDHVQITVAESIGVAARGGYYDRAGALRDMVQNHMMQLLCLVAMEPPVSLSADAIRNEKVKVLDALRPIPPECAADGVVRGQ